MRIYDVRAVHGILVPPAVHPVRLARIKAALKAQAERDRKATEAELDRLFDAARERHRLH